MQEREGSGNLRELNWRRREEPDLPTIHRHLLLPNCVEIAAPRSEQGSRSADIQGKPNPLPDPVRVPAVEIRYTAPNGFDQSVTMESPGTFNVRPAFDGCIQAHGSKRESRPKDSLHIAALVKHD